MPDSVRCPRCAPDAPLLPPDRGEISGHLVDEHGLSGLQAIAKARELLGEIPVIPPTSTRKKEATTHVVEKAQAPPAEAGAMKKTRATKGTEQPTRKCRNCRKPGHRADRCPETARQRATRGGGRA